MTEKTATTNIHHLIILDESGSMQSIADQTISSFNALMQQNQSLLSENPDQEHRISFFTFNGKGIKTIVFNQMLNEPVSLSESNYRPNDNTPLWDAMGSSILKVKHLVYGKPDHHVLVTIITDGAENVSREFTGKEIKDMITTLKENNWAFAYLGTDHDIESAADEIGMHSGNRLNWDKTSIHSTVELMQEMRLSFAYRVQSKEKVDDNLVFEAVEKIKKKTGN